MSVKRYEVNGSSCVFEDENGILVDYDDYAALEARCAALAAENAALKDGVNKAVEDIQCFYDSYGWHVSEDGESETAVVALDDAKGSIEHFALSVKTPATDAFLDEVRAHGVEMMREHPAIKLCSLTHVCDEFAAKLRKGGEA